MEDLSSLSNENVCGVYKAKRTTFAAAASVVAHRLNYQHAVVGKAVVMLSLSGLRRCHTAFIGLFNAHSCPGVRNQGSPHTANSIS